MAACQSLHILNPNHLFMPAVSFSQLDFIVNKARETQSYENKDAAVDALLSFARADNPKQRIKASTILPEFHEICAHRKSLIHEAIFDLCEDPLEHVRIAGYHAIVDLSKRASSVRRKNADVLCQLLQSGMPHLFRTKLPYNLFTSYRFRRSQRARSRPRVPQSTCPNCPRDHLQHYG
jgi:hypothetical protein